MTGEAAKLRARYHELFGISAPSDMTAGLIRLAIGWQELVDADGDISPAMQRDLQVIARTEQDRKRAAPADGRSSTGSNPRVPPVAIGGAASLPASTQLVPGARLVKVYQGVTHVVEVGEGSFSWQGTSYASLSAVAKAITGTHWNGLLFFGLRTRRMKPRHERAPASPTRDAQLRARKVARHA